MLLDQIIYLRLTATEVVRRFRDAWLQQSPERIPQVWAVLAIHEMPNANEFNMYKYVHFSTMISCNERSE